MLECPICRRSYDGQFQVFVPPHDEAFDTVVCARRAAEVWGWDTAAPVPVILPTIEAVRARSETHVTSAARRRGIAALAGDLVSGQAALATGVGLFAAGAAASIYLWARPGETVPSFPIAAGAPDTRQTTGPPPAATLPAATRPAATGSPRTRPAPQAVSRAKFVANTDTGRSAGTASGKRTETVVANSPSAPALSTSPAESPVGSTTHAPKPPPSTPKAPPVTPKPPAPSSSPPPAPSPPPVNPAGQAEPLSGGGGTSPAGSPAPQPPSSQPPSSQPPPSPPPPSPPPPSPSPPPQTPPSSTPPSSDESGHGDEDDDHEHGDDGDEHGDDGDEHGDDGDEHGDDGDEHEQPSSTRPGNGWGDENHDHTGPPGQGNNGNGDGNGNGHDHGH